MYISIQKIGTGSGRRALGCARKRPLQEASKAAVLGLYAFWLSSSREKSRKIEKSPVESRKVEKSREKVEKSREKSRKVEKKSRKVEKSQDKIEKSREKVEKSREKSIKSREKSRTVENSREKSRKVESRKVDSRTVRPLNGRVQPSIYIYIYIYIYICIYIRRPSGSACVRKKVLRSVASRAGGGLFFSSPTPGHARPCQAVPGRFSGILVLKFLPKPRFHSRILIKIY